MSQQKQAIWKRLFIVLLSINAFVLIALFILIFSPPPEHSINPKQNATEELSGAKFTVRSSKDNLSQLVNGYLDKVLHDSKGKYTVTFEQDVQFEGSVEAFNKDIPFTIRMKPIVQENGDIVLQQEEMSLGLLLLPKNKILEYVDKQADLPEWIQIDPKNEQIYVRVTQMELESNFHVQIQQFDLANDRLSFQIQVPTETLGL
ncbi:hypothetical protein Pryu01_00953 [Paraliobacillus ryukyuensis]|uniref:Uncharacterized protein YpmS n=1 Tax=Paraliobacillus ryukyuensis TaxID=200904 RepID=A0A366EG99_9BACI|nr:YpmS family protein [Paraliobacillus ryukyuensis]RBP00475.1 uncharacterized protein YpmS [Paraliobacillus ryukyuensis]